MPFPQRVFRSLVSLEVMWAEKGQPGLGSATWLSMYLWMKSKSRRIPECPGSQSSKYADSLSLGAAPCGYIHRHYMQQDIQCHSWCKFLVHHKYWRLQIRKFFCECSLFQHFPLNKNSVEHYRPHRAKELPFWRVFTLCQWRWGPDLYFSSISATLGLMYIFQ